MQEWFKGTQKNFTKWPDVLLTLALLIAGGVIMAIALEPDHKILKATVLAYIVLP